MLLSIILFTRKINHAGNVLLAAAMLALSADVFNSAYIMFGYYKDFPHYLGVTYAFPFLYGPVFYLYTKLVSRGENKFNPVYYLHFIPFMLVVLYGFMFVYLESSEFKLSLVNQGENVLPALGLISYFKPLHGIVYMLLTIGAVRDFNKRIKNSYSNIEKINLNWLRALTVGLCIVWGIVVLNYIANAFSSRDVNLDYLIYMAASILIYAIGYISLKQPQIFTSQDQKTYAETVPVTLPEKAEPGSYYKSGLSDTEAQVYLKKLLSMMHDEKPYLNSELTLRDLAESLSVSTHNLSEILNTRINKSFYDFINGYRVEEVKRKLAEGESEKYNLLAIAYDSGFNSKSSFNSVFKKLTGVTPSQYRKHLQQELIQQQD